MADLHERLRTAIARRAPLRDAKQTATTAYRLVNGGGDGLPDFTLDLFSDVLVLSLYRELPPQEEQGLADAILDVLPCRSLYLKRRPREARVVATTQKEQLAPEEPFRGEEAQTLVALENGRLYEIRPAQGLSVGLYLDMRDPRQWLSEHVRGQTVLNLFAYTCAFGVVSLSGGATRAANVDLSRKVLDWGARNAELNGHEPERRDYLSGDSFEWLERFAKKGERFDWVVLDPPSFATSKRGRFSAAKDYAALVTSAARVVSPKGNLLACCNLATLERGRFERMVLSGLAAAGRKGRVSAQLGASAIDFPAAPGSEPALKVLALALDR